MRTQTEFGTDSKDGSERFRELAWFWALGQALGFSSRLQLAWPSRTLTGLLK